MHCRRNLLRCSELTQHPNPLTHTFFFQGNTLSSRAEYFAKIARLVPARLLQQRQSRNLTWFSVRQDALRTFQKFFLSYRVDLSIAVALMAFAGFGSYWGSGLFNPAINSLEAFDVWFDSDAPRVFDDMVSRFAWNTKADVHPLFALLAYPLVYLLRSVLGFDVWVAVRLVIASVAGLWLAALFILLRSIGLRRNDALLFTLVGAVSASSMFWFVLPETVSFSSLTILLALIVVAVACKRSISPVWTVAVSVLTLSVTISNWLVGLLATAAMHTKTQAIKLTMFVICIALLLSSVQLLLFPRAVLFGDIRRILAEEPEFVLRSDSGTRAQSVKALLFHSMIMPEIKVFDPYWDWLKWKIMRVQLSDVGSGSIWGLAAVPVWCALMGLGLWALFTVKDQGPMQLVLCGSILAQLGLHSFFGREPFLYSLYFGPLLIVLAAFGTLTRHRRVSLGLATVLLILAATNNALQFHKALEFFHLYRPSTQKIKTGAAALNLDEVANRQKAPPLLITDEGNSVKGYMQADGSFSPGEGTFGVSIWPVSRDNVLVTSWFPGRSHEISWSSCAGFPVVKTSRYYYETTVRVGQTGNWNIFISQMNNFATRLLLVVQSSGPSGSNIYALDWNSHRLLINNRWKLEAIPAPIAVQVGEEESPGRFVKRKDQWQSRNGVGSALVELSPQSNNWQLVISDLQANGGSRHATQALRKKGC
jgi:hypothetical protein